MTSDDSDDEPLSLLLGDKKRNSENFDEYVPEEDSDDEDYLPSKKELSKKKKKKTKEVLKKFPSTLKISRRGKPLVPTPIVERPLDVWMYLKDMKPIGPYSCLLCPEWFINRTKVLAHYILNHKKDYCGICRYFVSDRESWEEHLKFHTPWPCSQCIENFPTENELRQHMSEAHNLVHCRICHFRISDDEQYKSHLIQKHNVTNETIKENDFPWMLEYDGSSTFQCLLCCRSNIQCATFFNHCIGYHHFTIKCLASIVCCKDVPFTVSGADVSPEFLEQLKYHGRCGYVDFEHKLSDTKPDDMCKSELAGFEIKREVVSDTDGNNDENNTMEHSTIIMDEKDNDKTENLDDEFLKSYTGEEDFDVTLMELVVLQRCFFDYASELLIQINSNKIPENSMINYENVKHDFLTTDVDCEICETKSLTLHSFITHMSKFHNVKSLPLYSCRACGRVFESHHELTSHVNEEMLDFEDLWICQFCDKEFDTRESTRHHLTEHWDVIEYDNCFSPHLGFKCRYCPTLFWNETDREIHQTKVHFTNNRDNFYKCEVCLEMFSDKVWFVHHHLEKHEHESKQVYMLKCCMCLIVLKSVEDMRVHFSSRHPDARKIYCNLDSCQFKPLSHRKSFNLHVKFAHSSKGRVNQTVNCNVCEREFSSVRACSVHTAQIHSPGKYKCSICKELMRTMDERKLHYLLSHPGQHPFECRDCGKSFLYKSSLYMHRQEHAPNKQNFTCTYCGKVFAKKDSFREHVQIHEGPRHACSYCPMRFVQRSNMLRHERRHTGERPYHCAHCPRTFADKGACTSHTRTHLNNTPFACMYCGQTFMQKSKLTYHIRKHTGENLETCPVCSKLFTSACSLREHMKTHSSVADAVKCPLCDKMYKDDRCMVRHLRTTHSGPQFTCPLCSKTLSSASGLRHHVMTHSHLNTFRCKCCSESAACKRTIVRHLRKRHGLKPAEVHIKNYYRILEPRECKLGLDDETMNNIFGPPKKSQIGDLLSIEKSPDSNDRNEGSDEDDSKESDGDSGEDDEGRIKIKTEPEFDPPDFEPTDFVTVKIEQFEPEERVDFVE